MRLLWSFVQLLTCLMLLDHQEVSSGVLIAHNPRVPQSAFSRPNVIPGGPKVAPLRASTTPQHPNIPSQARFKKIAYAKDQRPSPNAHTRHNNEVIVHKFGDQMLPELEKGKKKPNLKPDGKGGHILHTNVQAVIVQPPHGSFSEPRMHMTLATHDPRNSNHGGRTKETWHHIMTQQQPDGTYQIHPAGRHESFTNKESQHKIAETGHFPIPPNANLVVHDTSDRQSISAAEAKKTADDARKQFIAEQIKAGEAKRAQRAATAAAAAKSGTPGGSNEEVKGLMSEENTGTKKGDALDAPTPPKNPRLERF